MPTVAEMKAQVDRIWQQTCHTELGDQLAAQVRQHALAGVKAALETAVREEVLAYRVEAMTPGMRLSGTYTRQVLTTHGMITDFQQPKLRCGNRERVWQIPHQSAKRRFSASPSPRAAHGNSQRARITVG